MNFTRRLLFCKECPCIYLEDDSFLEKMFNQSYKKVKTNDGTSLFQTYVRQICE